MVPGINKCQSPHLFVQLLTKWNYVAGWELFFLVCTLVTFVQHFVYALTFHDTEAIKHTLFSMPHYFVLATNTWWHLHDCQNNNYRPEGLKSDLVGSEEPTWCVGETWMSCFIWPRIWWCLMSVWWSTSCTQHTGNSKEGQMVFYAV